MSCLRRNESDNDQGFHSMAKPPRFPSRKYSRREPNDKDEHKIMERVLKELSEGSILYKVKSSTRLLERTFYLDIENMHMYYTGSKKKNRDTAVRISKIREVREGEKDYSKKLKDLDPSLCFVVILGASHSIMHLRATRPDIRDKWIRGLRYAMQMEQLSQQRNETDRWVRDAFNMADKNSDGQLDFDEVMKLLRALNADITRKYAKEMFDAADTNKNVSKGRAGLDREEFVTFYNNLTKRVELEEVFLKYSRSKGHMSVQDLLVFLRDGQKTTIRGFQYLRDASWSRKRRELGVPLKMADATEEHCRSVIDECEPDGACKTKEQLSMVGFRNFLSSERQMLFRPDHRVVYQDMSKPMTHYFIASSHNTYLAEDQLKGPSQVEMYISSLKKGCRCVELDCWDGPDNEPVIYHGYTLTSKILFKDVIKAINDYAFEASPYPVTLSLENHCSIEQQKVMANHLTFILGEKLWVPETDVIETPSPEELRNKILIKGKRLPKTLQADEDVSDEDEAADVPLEGDQSEAKKSSHGSHKKIKLNAQLSDMTTMQSVAHKSVESSPDANKFFSVISLGENKVEKMIQNNPGHLNAITHHTLIRTYPAGTRTDSSNYNPVPEWNQGCQIVALNYQTSGECMQLNHGKFLDNGKCGYLLKPYFLMSEKSFDMTFSGSTARSISKKIQITIISGYQIPKPNDSTKGEIIDPFVKIEVYGVPSDVADYKTKVIENNGFNPRWYETQTFNIRVPELAVIRFTVTDQDRGLDDFIGYYCLPVTSIQEGFRHFPLFDKYGSQYSQSVIFTHIAISPMDG